MSLHPSLECWDGDIWAIPCKNPPGSAKKGTERQKQSFASPLWTTLQGSYEDKSMVGWGKKKSHACNFKLVEDTL